MVERSASLDLVYGSLADPTRRDILRRLAGHELSIRQIAHPYKITFAAISKHVMVLERAGLVTKRRRSKEQVVSLLPKALVAAADYLKFYQDLWEGRMDSLAQYLAKEKE